jgi:hypothetical protein
MDYAVTRMSPESLVNKVTMWHLSNSPCYVAHLIYWLHGALYQKVKRTKLKALHSLLLSIEVKAACSFASFLLLCFLFRCLDAAIAVQFAVSDSFKRSSTLRFLMFSPVLKFLKQLSFSSQ